MACLDCHGDESHRSPTKRDHVSAAQIHLVKALQLCNCSMLSSSWQSVEPASATWLCRGGTASASPRDWEGSYIDRSAEQRASLPEKVSAGAFDSASRHRLSVIEGRGRGWHREVCRVEGFT